VTQPATQPVIRSYATRFDLFALVQMNSARYPYLLESTARQDKQHSDTARYDILLCHPLQTLQKHSDNSLTLNGAACPGEGFLPTLDQLWREHAAAAQNAPDLPFSGGWFVYLGYELAAEIEPTLQLPNDDSQLPIAQATRIPAAIIYDHARERTTVVVEAAYAMLLDEIEHDLLRQVVPREFTQSGLCPSLREDDPQTYLTNTQKVLDYIRDGDVFQVNLSRQWQGRVAREDVASPLYQRLRRSNPAPFAGFAALAAGTIVSSSPERLVRVRARHIETRPIAGTRPRMPTTQQDLSMQDELIGHPKERAEHVMLIDLERNDLGRLCVPGSVKVDEMMVIESYAHVHHIVSNVCGELREGISPGEIIAAVFPGGTITGCPKVRCMQIIAELEKTARGPYTGSLGYLNHSGDMDLNILIRTISVEQERLRFRTGAGLVADSKAEFELAETRAKAKGLLLAIAGQANDAAATLPG
jgi:anthranilate synthase component 1